MKNHIEILLLTIVFFIPQAVLACDLSAFQQSDFSERCQRLIDYCKKAYISKKVNYPDTEKKLNEVSKDWIDFYLSHGNQNVQPPNMKMVKPEVWDRNLKALGIKFNNFIRKKIDSKAFQSLILEVTLFKDENKLSQLHDCFKAAEIYEKDILKIEDYDLWLEARLLTVARLINEYEEEIANDLLFDLDMTVKEHIEAIERFKTVFAEPDKSIKAKQNLFNMINRSIDQTLNNWEISFYYK